VGIDDALPLILWARYFIEVQDTLWRRTFYLLIGQVRYSVLNSSHSKMLVSTTSDHF
jgi:hypothetical protein